MATLQTKSVIHSQVNPNNYCHICYDSEYDEWQVLPYANEIPKPKAIYYADSEEDAIGTAGRMLHELDIAEAKMKNAG